MRNDANQIAYAVVESILAAAHSFTLQVAGTDVEVSVSNSAPVPWPAEGIDGVAARPLMPGPVRAECTWRGGSVSLIVDYLRESPPHYRGSVTLRIATDARWLVVVNVRSVLEDAVDGEVAHLTASTSLMKRGVPEQSEVNRALQTLVAGSGLMMRSKRAEIARIQLPDGSIESGAAGAFERCVLLALLKLDFTDRTAVKTRGTPLVDLAKLHLSPPALAALAEMPEAEDDVDAVARIRRRVGKAVPDPVERRAALELLAYAIENAHDERPGGWCLGDRYAGLQLQTGRLFACRIKAGMIDLSVVGPISTDTRSALSAKEESETDAWKAVPGGLSLQFPAGKAAEALALLKDPFDRFVDAAMARMGRPLDPDSHVPEIVTYVAEELGRDLPQPVFDAPATGAGGSDDGEEDAEGLPASLEPVERGRGPIFNKSHRQISSLLSDIERGEIALPDMQRPFVWPDTSVRQLLDSLFVGYPTGTVVLWQTEDPNARRLGSDTKASRASTLVIDGQQRLTSLFAVMKGVAVRDADGESRSIKIAFRPRDGRFQVADAAIRQDPEFLTDITEVWRGPRDKKQIRRDMIEALRAKKREVDQKYQDAMEHNLDRLKSIDEFEFPVIEIRKGEATDEQVADIFVRINNQGTRLGQADFVLTLLSVFHGELRDRIEARATAISAESVIGIDPQQLLRAACAVAFERARMSAVYKFLRGVDPDTGDTNPQARQERLSRLDAAADECLETTAWRDYLKRVSHAGFVNAKLVAAPNAVVNAFAFYVKGRRAGVEQHQLDRLISQWLFGTLVTARYSTSAETNFEADLILVRGLAASDGPKFVAALDEVLATNFTGDYWSRTLVGELQTQRNRAPSVLAFRAAQVVLGARALFSDALLQTMLSPGPSATKAAIEQHHLFPKAWLLKKGVTDRRAINQVANLADVGWNVNSEIGASGPAAYVPRLRDKLKLDDGRWARMCAEHALPVGWENLPYDAFLDARRPRMADIIRAAYRQLGGEEDAAPVAPPWFLPGAEMVWGRIVETERALRAMVREVYGKRFAANAATKIEATIPENQRDSLTRALRSRPAGADPMSVVDYLYLGQLPPLLFANEVWSDVRVRLGNAGDSKQRLSSAVDSIAPVRNEIAHVREVSPERLQKANVACNDVLAMTGRP